MKFAAFGRTHWLYDSILACVEAGHECVLIGTCAAAPEYKIDEKAFERLAYDIGSEFFFDSNINRPLYQEMAQASEAVAAISVNWLTLIRQPMLDLFRYGILNAHAGDLPRYRGNAAPNWAILADEDQIVLTIHQMSEDLDAGPILLKEPFALTPETYIGDVYRFMEQRIPRLFAEALAGLAKQSLLPQAQPSNPALSLRCFPRLPRDSELDWNQPAEQLARIVRASSEPFSGAYTFIDTEKITIWRAHASALPYPYMGTVGQVVERRPDSGEVVALAGDGVLVLEEIETARRGRGAAAKFIKSLRTRFGINTSNVILDLQRQIEQLEAGLRAQGNQDKDDRA